MLERIKKKQLEGFKEFVHSMETTGTSKRTQIVTAGVLEDPNFMFWVMKNMKTMEDFMTLPGEDVQAVLSSHPQIINVFAKAVFDLPKDQLDNISSSVPKFASQIKDELSYLKEVTGGERESARYFLLKTVRKLQDEEKIQGFGWRLPPMEIFYPKSYPDGKTEIFFESGVLAASGETLRNKRSGSWIHYYDTGKLLAKGTYLEGAKSGDWEFYYGTGNKRAQGEYVNDLRNGVWQEWDRNNVLSEVLYNEGVRQD